MEVTQWPSVLICQDRRNRVLQTFIPSQPGGWTSKIKMAAGLVLPRPLSWASRCRLHLVSSQGHPSVHAHPGVCVSKFPPPLMTPVTLDQDHSNTLILT